MSKPRYLPIHHIVIEEKKPSTMKMVNEYLMITKLGTGYSSKVYLALRQDENISSTKESKKQEYYAAKAIRVHEKRLNGLSSASLEREIKFLRSFDHPNIIKLHSVLYTPSTDFAYVIMEWANCGTLQHAISNNCKFNENSIASIYIQIALAISYLHSKGIAHRDVKPSNILLFSDGTAKLSDFGISHFFESAESVIGTPSYQSPDLFDEGDEDLFESLSDSDNSDYGNDFSIFDYSKDDILKNSPYLQKNNNNFSLYSKSHDGFSHSNSTGTLQLHASSFSVANEKNYTLSKNNNHITFNSNDNLAKGTNFSFVAQDADEINSFENNDKDEKEKKRIDPKKGDVWSLGISMYQTAYGVLPYDGKNMYEIVNKINNSPLIIPENNERKYSPLFIDLIQKMLKNNTDERLSMDEVIQHPFFSRYQSNLDQNQTKSDLNLIVIKNNIVMQKVLFNIEPFKPPKSLKPQVLKIDAIVCSENYSFSSGLRSVSRPSWRFNFLDESKVSTSHIEKSYSVNSCLFS